MPATVLEVLLHPTFVADLSDWGGRGIPLSGVAPQEGAESIWLLA